MVATTTFEAKDVLGLEAKNFTYKNASTTGTNTDVKIQSTDEYAYYAIANVGAESSFGQYTIAAGKYVFTLNEYQHLGAGDAVEKYEGATMWQSSFTDQKNGEVPSPSSKTGYNYLYFDETDVANFGTATDYTATGIDLQDTTVQVYRVLKSSVEGKEGAELISAIETNGTNATDEYKDTVIADIKNYDLTNEALAADNSKAYFAVANVDSDFQFGSNTIAAGNHLFKLAEYEHKGAGATATDYLGVTMWQSYFDDGAQENANHYYFDEDDVAKFGSSATYSMKSPATGEDSTATVKVYVVDKSAVEGKTEAEIINILTTKPEVASVYTTEYQDAVADYTYLYESTNSSLQDGEIIYYQDGEELDTNYIQTTADIIKEGATLNASDLSDKTYTAEVTGNFTSTDLKEFISINKDVTKAVTINAKGEDDTVIAGNIVTRKDATGADDGTKLNEGYGATGSDFATATFFKLNTKNNTLNGGEGDDNIYSGSGNDTIIGGAGNDAITLNGGNNTLVYTSYTAEGTDTVFGATSKDTVEFYKTTSEGALEGYKLSGLKFEPAAPLSASTKIDLLIKDSSDNLLMTIDDFFVTNAESKAEINSINLSVLTEGSDEDNQGAVTVKYATDATGKGTVYVENVSDYKGVQGLEEVVALQKGSKAIEFENNENVSLDGKTYSIYAKADMTGATVTVKDTVYGSSSNDYIQGGNIAGNMLFGGSQGHDFIKAGSGGDIIIAGEINSNGTAIKPAAEEIKVKFNSTASDLIGGDGNDIIYSGSGNDYIKAGAGDDTINLNGGANTILYDNDDFGADTIYKATSKDTLKFANEFDGFLDKLSFAKSIVAGHTDDLIITNTAGGKTTIVDFFKDSDAINKIVAKNAHGIDANYTILKDAVIDMGNVTGSTYNEIKYNKSVSVGATDTTFTMGANKNTIKFTAATVGNTVINLTKGETLNLDFSTFTGDISTMTYDKDNKTDLVLKLGAKTITVKDYLKGNTGANLLINDNDMYDWSYVATGLKDLADAKTVDVVEATAAMSKKGKIVATSASQLFDVQDYVSSTSKGVVIEGKKGGDNAVVGSNYNDKVTFTKGNNEIVEFEGKNTVKTGAGDDSFEALGSSSNTVNLGNGNNAVEIDSIGTNKVTTGKGNDTITLDNGKNTVKAGDGNNGLAVFGGTNNITAGKGNDFINLVDGNNTVKAGDGNNIMLAFAGTNKITTGKGNDEFTLNDGENTIKSGKGNDVFDIDGGINKITASGTKTQKTTVDISDGYNTITTGAGADEFNVTGGVNNTIKSGKGNDKFTVSGGKNTIYASTGNDTLNISDAFTTTIADMGDGNDKVEISVASINNIKLGKGNDTITVTDGNNIIDAGDGNDKIEISGAGDNTVYGGKGNDTFIVGAVGGDNVLNGGAGKDTYDLVDFDFGKDLVITDTSSISTIKLDDVIKIGSAGNGTNYSFFANVTLDKNAKSGYKVSGYTITEDVVTAGAVTGYDADKVSVNLGANKKVNLSYGDNAATSVNLNEIASDVASWLSNDAHSYASVDALLGSGDTVNINAFLQTFAVDKTV